MGASGANKGYKETPQLNSLQGARAADRRGGHTEHRMDIAGWESFRGGALQLLGNHGKGHCTIKVSPDVIVVTGGWNGKSPSWTSRSYNLGTGAETNVGKMFVRRYMHACGVYEDTSHRQVRTVSFLFLLRPKLLSILGHIFKLSST